MSRYILYKQVHTKAKKCSRRDDTFQHFLIALRQVYFCEKLGHVCKAAFQNSIFKQEHSVWISLMILSSLKNKFKLTWDPVKILPPWQSRLVKGCGWARIAFFHSNFRSSSDEYLKKFSQLLKETPLLVLAWSAKILTNMVWWLERYHIF